RRLITRLINNLSFLLMPLHPPKPTLFPYTTLFRSAFFSLSRSTTPSSFWAAARSASSLSYLPRRLSSCPLMKPSASRMSCRDRRSEEHTSELQSRGHLVCRLLLEKKHRKNASLRSG